MRSRLNQMSVVAVTATMVTALLVSDGSGAAAQDNESAPMIAESATQFVSEPVVQSLPVVGESEALPEGEQLQDDISVPATSLAMLVDSQPGPGALSREMHCLAGAVYFESRGESLNGQLAVARVIMERAASRRFPNSYCGVVYQRSQFSFVRGNSMPAVRTSSNAWRKAVAIAEIANDGGWESQVEGALFFHAARISPGWRLKRIARVDNHVFYR